MKLKSLLLLWIFMSGPSLGLAQDVEEEVRSFMTQRDQEIKDAVRGMKTDPSLREVARSLINDQIDFEEMGKRSLGRYYEDLTPEERQEFIEVFGGIVRSQSLGDLSVYEAPVSIESVAINGDQATVNTTAEIREDELDVVYHLHRKEESWWLYDIVIDGVGTVEGYSVSFQTFLRKRGFEAFMQSLRKKLAATED
ncbi:MAG: ABC transporter substrate-binding protein [Bacteroidetes bacterium]|nr:ABC transporter substrate-binding protein [Bacteroidota bacterium]MCY4204369.1 ABC transporter substrate-binding protein [Bacteroidota bacterium]